jgi:hypothetical protein
MICSKNANQDTRLRHLRLGFQLHTPSAGAEQFQEKRRKSITLNVVDLPIFQMKGICR